MKNQKSNKVNCFILKLVKQKVGASLSSFSKVENLRGLTNEHICTILQKSCLRKFGYTCLPRLGKCMMAWGSFQPFKKLETVKLSIKINELKVHIAWIWHLSQRKHHLRGEQKNDSTKKVAMLCKSGYQIVIFIFLLNLTNKVRCCRVVGTTLTALKESLIFFNKSLFMLFLKILCFPFAYLPHAHTAIIL